jgi:hypothetical protein
MVALCAFGTVACEKAPDAGKSSAPSGGAGSASPPMASAGRGELPACSIVSLQEVETTLGITGLSGPNAMGEPPVRACEFTGGSLNLPLVTVRFEIVHAGDFPLIRKNHESAGQATADLPGLGDAAFTVSLGKPLGVSFLHDKTVVFITTVRAPIDKQIALARIVLQRL